MGALPEGPAAGMCINEDRRAAPVMYQPTLAAVPYVCGRWREVVRVGSASAPYVLESRADAA